jgi:PKD repeat protein
LYAGEENTNTLSQFDLSSGNAATITASKVIVGTTSLSAFQGMQLAPDGKLYLAHNGWFYLGVVNDPDVYGAACNYTDTGFYLGGLTCGYGLPGFMENLFMQNVPPVALFSAPNHICPGTCTAFTNLSQNATSYLWTFNGATPSTSVDANPAGICYNTPGSYTVQLIASNTVTSDTLTLNNYIIVYPYPPPQGITQSGDTLFAIQGSATYQWYHDGVLIAGATDFFYLAAEGGNYNVVCTDANGCEVEAAIFDVVANLAQPLTGSGSLKVTPNPAFSELRLEFSDGMLKGPNQRDKIAVQVYNSFGEKVITNVRDLAGNQNTMDVSELPAGMYFVEVKSSERIFRTNFIKSDIR